MVSHDQRRMRAPCRREDGQGERNFVGASWRKASSSSDTVYTRSRAEHTYPANQHESLFLPDAITGESLRLQEHHRSIGDLQHPSLQHPVAIFATPSSCRSKEGALQRAFVLKCFFARRTAFHLTRQRGTLKLFRDRSSPCPTRERLTPTLSPSYLTAGR